MKCDENVNFVMKCKNWQKNNPTRKEARDLWVWLLVGLIWVTAIGCILIMKKLQPENTLVYALWAVGWCVAITIFAAVVQAAG